MRFLGLALLLCLRQDVPELIGRLGDDDPVVRDEAADQLVRGYAGWRRALEERRDATRDEDLRDRLSKILAEGRRRGLRDELGVALPDRVRRAFPGFAEALFSTKPEDRAAAMRGLKQTFNAEAEQNRFPGLFLTPGEMKRIFPLLRAALDPAPEFERQRHEWVGVLCAHDGLLDVPEWAAAARELFKDPSKTVREHALVNLANRVARPDDLEDLIARWDTLDVNGRWRVLHEVAGRKLESAYPFLRRELDDPERGETAARLILQHRLAPLRESALLFMDRHLSKIHWMDTFEHLEVHEASPLLLRKLRETRGNEAEILSMLGRRGAPEAADAAAGCLGHSDWRVRDAAVRCLQGIGSPRHAPAVARLLREFCESPDPPDIAKFYPVPAEGLLVRWEAGEEIAGLLEFLPKLSFYQLDPGAVLGKLKPPGAGKKLAVFLRPGDPTAYRALELLAAAGFADDARAHLDAIRALFQDPAFGKDVLFRCAARLGLRELIPLLLDHLDAPGLFRPGSALAELWTPEERKAALSDPDPKARIGGILAAGSEPGLLDPLLRDPEPRVRRALASVLNQRIDEEASALLLQLAKDPDPSVSEAAVNAFFFTHRPLWVAERLADLLRHPAPALRLRAAAYVTRDFVRVHSDLLRGLLEDPDPKLREALATASPFLDKDASAKALRTLEKETDAGVLVTTLYRLSDAFTDEERGSALLRLYERLARQKPADLVATRSYSFLGEVVQDAAKVLETASRLLPGAKGADFEPVLLRLLASDEVVYQKGAAAALALLGSRPAVPRLVELVESPAGDEAAEALAKLKAFPAKFLRHGDPEIRKRAVHAAALSKDSALFDILLEAAAELSGDPFTEAVEALAATARPDQAARLLRLMATPVAQDRRTVLEKLRRFPVPELTEPVAEFLDDNYFVRGSAAEFLMDAGGDRYAEKMARQTGGYGARVVSRYGLRSHVGPLLQWLEVPGNPAMNGAAVDVVRTLAELGMREHLPAAVAKLKALPPESRRLMLFDVVRLGGRDVVLGELRGGDPETRLAAAHALFAAGARDPEIRQVAREQPARAGSVIVALGDRELAERALERPGASEAEWAVAARLGVERARARAAEALRRKPEALLFELQRAWKPHEFPRGYDGHEWMTWRKGSALLEKLCRDWGREIVFGTPPPEGFAESFVRGARMEDLFEALPWKASFHVDARDRIVVDRLENSVAGWIERLTR